MSGDEGVDVAIGDPLAGQPVRAEVTGQSLGEHQLLVWMDNTTMVTMTRWTRWTRTPAPCLDGQHGHGD